jgi:ecdysteroid kinase
MEHVVTQLEQATPAWLTQRLQESGALACGRVLTVEATSETTIRSVVGHLSISYSVDAPASAPRRLFFKTGTHDLLHSDDWLAEVSFYQNLAPATSSQTVPCFAAAYAPHPARFHLLLADLSSTHSHAQWPLPPSHTQLEQAVDCLAAIHAHWWEHPRFGQDIHPRFDETSLADWLAVWEQQLARYLDFLGDRLPARRRVLYEQALEPLLALILRRRQSRRHYTLAHQDPHPYNFLFPHDTAADTTRLIDWSTWDIELGARDLAYLIALHFFPEHRARVERPLLERYYDALIALGVRNYRWDQLWADYRLFAIWNLFIPIEQFWWGVPARVWWLHAERAFLAFDDLGCAELLG